MKIDIIKVGNAIGATIPLIIACTIFLHQIIAKAVDAMASVRGLTDEYRKIHKPDSPETPPREQMVIREIALYQERFHKLSMGLNLILFSELFFIITILSAGAAVIYPDIVTLPYLAMAGLAVGLILMASATILELSENVVASAIMKSEVTDIAGVKETDGILDKKAA